MQAKLFLKVSKNIVFYGWSVKHLKFYKIALVHSFDILRIRLILNSMQAKLFLKVSIKHCFFLWMVGQTLEILQNCLSP